MEPKFEVEPSSDVKPFLPLLALRTVSETRGPTMCPITTALRMVRAFACRHELAQIFNNWSWISHLLKSLDGAANHCSVATTISFRGSPLGLIGYWIFLNYDFYTSFRPSGCGRIILSGSYMGTLFRIPCLSHDTRQAIGAPIRLMARTLAHGFRNGRFRCAASNRDLKPRPSPAIHQGTSASAAPPGKVPPRIIGRRQTPTR